MERFWVIILMVIFFKEALLLVSEECPYRGAEIYKRGEYIYVSDIEGGCNFF